MMPSCPVCKAKDNKPLATTDEFLHKLWMRYCNYCGMVFSIALQKQREQYPAMLRAAFKTEFPR